MRKIRVMIVDDSVVVRRIVSDVLASDPEVEVAGVAINGRVALEKLDQVDPDVVILDLEMPELDGLATLAELRKRRPRIPVIMYSTTTRRGATATLDALALGASDYLTKPSRTESPAEAISRVREDLIPKVKSLGGSTRAQSLIAANARPRTIVAKAPRRTSNAKLGLVAIGCSTGGPNALAMILPAIPPDFSVPIVIVQHMPPLFTAMLAERLAMISRIKVHEATHGERLLPGHAYIAPGGYHLTVVKERGVPSAVLNQDEQENSCRPSVDVLFRSVARVYGEACLGVVLTGIGRDGTKGTEAIRNGGGIVYVQDEPSSVVWGMPGSVVEAGLADRVIPLDFMANAVVTRTSFAGPLVDATVSNVKQGSRVP